MKMALELVMPDEGAVNVQDMRVQIPYVTVLPVAQATVPVSVPPGENNVFRVVKLEVLEVCLIPNDTAYFRLAVRVVLRVFLTPVLAVEVVSTNTEAVPVAMLSPGVV